MDQEIEQVIVRNLTGEASCDDKAKLSDWLALNEENKVSFAKFGSYWHANVSGVRIQDKEEAYKQLAGRIETPVRNVRAIPQWLKYAGVAAVVAVLTGLAAYWGIHPETPEEIHHYSYTTGSSSSAFRLPDGTEVSLNRHSTLTYSDRYGNAAREVALQGEAFFEVVKNKELPFIVSLNENRIVVLGTTFNVKNYPEESTLTATLVEGSIRFETPSQVVILKPDQQLSYNRQDNTIGIDRIESEMATAWKDNLLRYKSIPFAEFLALLEKQYGVEILLSDEVSGMNKVSGSFDANLSVEQILNLMKKSLAFNWKKKENTYVITK